MEKTGGKLRIRLLALLLSALTVLVLVAAGCTQPAPKPAPPTPPPRTAPAPAPGPPAAPAGQPLPTAPAELSRLADRLAAEAARVEGVNKATVVINERTALVGLNLQAGIEAGRTDSIKRTAADRLRRAEPRLTNVVVATDADTVTRLRRIADGLKAGKPLSSFAREIAEITRRLAPTSR